MIGKTVRVNCYKAVYSIDVTGVSDKGISGVYKVLNYSKAARKYKPVPNWASSYGLFKWEELTSLKIVK